MFGKIRFLFILALVLFITPFATYAEEQTPHDIIKHTSEEVLAVLKKDSDEIKHNPAKINELVDEIILPICDVERMSKYILAKHWKTASEDERSAFISEFKKLLIRNYGKHIAEYSNATVTVIPDRKYENKLYQTVSTKLDTSIGSKPFQVDYVFRVTEESSKVVDVKVEGMSILKTFRTSFTTEIAETSLTELIERITLVNQPTLAMSH